MRHFLSEDTAELFDFSFYDYVVDAVDTVTAKLLLIEMAAAAGTPVISSMGTGNKLDPGRFEITDISKTSVCPLAKVMRRELKKRGIKKCKVLYSKEEPIKSRESEESKGTAKRPVPGSIAFVPGTAGLMIAGEVVRDLLKTAEIDVTVRPGLVTVQPTELLRHSAIENCFAMGRMPAGSRFYTVCAFPAQSLWYLAEQKPAAVPGTERLQ